MNDTENLTITSIVEDLNNTYARKVLVSTDAIHEELESHFLRQKGVEKRKNYYNNISTIDDMYEYHQLLGLLY